MSNKTLKDLSIIFFATFCITALIWLPHFLKLNFYNLNFSKGFNTIYRNFDGLEYVTIAKSLYTPSQIAKIPQSLPPSYFASHFPGYPLLILIFSPVFGFLKSMLFVSLLSTAASSIAFYFLIKDFKLSNHPLYLSLLFLILPARWVIIHSVGSSEPTFMFFLILSIFSFLKYEKLKKTSWIYLTALFGSFAQLTRPTGILLFISLTLFIHWNYFLRPKDFSFKKSLLEHLKYFPLILMPLTVLLIFYLFKLNLNDFYAYFHSGDNIHLSFPPFQVFNKNQYWVGDIWLEDIIYIFIIGLLAGLTLLKQKLYPFAFFVLTYLAATMFVSHRDISRYILPILPFTLIAFENILTSKEFKIVLVILSLAIYLYSQNFILANTAPIPNPILFN